jgi:hypothetical protein
MKTYDINSKHGLALVSDENGTYYTKLDEAPQDITPYNIVHLKQKHYVARAHARGLIVETVDPMLDGWQEWERLNRMLP